MTVFQLNRPQGSQATVLAPTVTQPAALVDRPGRHASDARARLTIRRMFYIARHIGR
jgi:hypothetical protein